MSRAVASQEIEAPNERELEWVQSHLAVARHLAALHTGNEDALLPDVHLLDEIFAAWLEAWRTQPPSEREDPNLLINAIGLAFGQALVDELRLEWAIVTDEHGTEIAVHGQPGDILVFPPNLVAKRFETGDTGFLVPIYDEIVKQVRALGKSPTDTA
jgi:uncharacterized protein DUF3806